MFSVCRDCHSHPHQCYHCRNGSHKTILREEIGRGETVEEAAVRMCAAAVRDEEE